MDRINASIKESQKNTKKNSNTFHSENTKWDNICFGFILRIQAGDQLEREKKK
jgi:hypothetical protein